MKKYLTNTLWVLFEKIVRLSVVFFFFSLVSQKLSVYDFGIFSLSQTVTTLMIGVVAFGFDNVLIKEFSLSQNVNELLSTSIIFRVLISILSIVFLVIVFSFYDNSLIYKFVFLASSLSVVFQTQTIYYSYYQAVSKSSIITKTSLLALLFSSLIKLFMLYVDAGLVFYTLSFSLDYLFSFLLIYIVSRKQGLEVRLKYFEKSVLIKMIRQSYPILISTLIIMIYTRIDQFMIVKMLGVEQLALFSVAVRISDAYMFIPMAISASFFPMVSKNPSIHNVQRYFNITHLFTVLTAIFVILVVPLVVKTFFGSRYLESINVIYIIVMANVISALGAVSSNILIIRDISHLRIYRAICGLVINIILNFVLIPRYGIIGAAYSSLLSQLSAAWLANYFNKKTRDCFYAQSKALLHFGLPSLKVIYLEYRGVEK